MWLLILATWSPGTYPERAEYWTERFPTWVACEVRRHAMEQSEWLPILRAECDALP